LRTVWHKSDGELVVAVGRECAKGCAVVCLDERGPTCTSIALSELVFRWLTEGGSRLAFVVGGAEGLPAALRPGRGASHDGRGSGDSAAEALRLRYLSLGRLTFTHQMARLILAEQIYRAVQIRAGTQYHKE